MAFKRVGSLAECKPGWVMEAKIDKHPYAICNHEGEIHCLDGECPCTGGPLGQGAIRHDMLVCPWHGWRFDYRNGVCAYDDSIKIAKYPVKIEGEDILVDVDNPINT